MENVIKVEYNLDYDGNKFPMKITFHISNKEQLRELYWRFFVDFRFYYEQRGFSSENIEWDNVFGVISFMKIQEVLKKMKIDPKMERKEKD